MRHVDRAADELQRLYESDVTFRLEKDSTGGIRVRIGDERTGVKAEAVVKTFDEAVYWLRAHARRFFPDSEYVKDLPQ